jgi:hypothetical protein
MAAVFISDDGPDAEEYENNYIHFNANNAEVLTKIEFVLASHRIHDPAVRKDIENLCWQSLKKIDSTRFTGLIKNTWSCFKSMNKA